MALELPNLVALSPKNGHKLQLNVHSLPVVFEVLHLMVAILQKTKQNHEVVNIHHLLVRRVGKYVYCLVTDLSFFSSFSSFAWLATKLNILAY